MFESRVMNESSVEDAFFHLIFLPLSISMSPTLLNVPLMLSGTPPDVQYVWPHAVFEYVVSLFAALALPTLSKFPEIAVARVSASSQSDCFASVGSEYPVAKLMAMVPELVTGVLLTENPVGTLTPTLVTVPTPPGDAGVAFTHLPVVEL